MRLYRLSLYSVLVASSVVGLAACSGVTNTQPSMRQVDQERAMKIRNQNQRARALSSQELERCDPEKDCPISPENDNRGE